MGRKRQIRMVVPLAAAAILVAGCPKKPVPAPGSAQGEATGSAALGAPGSAPGGAAGLSGAGSAGHGGVGPEAAAPGGPAGGGPGMGAVGGGGSTAAGRNAAGGPGVAGASGTAIPALPSLREFVETLALHDVHFDFDRYEIRPADAEVLKANAGWLKANPAALLLIEGHCDERGTNEYNLALGDRRGKATRDYLAFLGIESSRITLIGYGEERPLCTERTEECWARNRRTHFLVKQ